MKTALSLVDPEIAQLLGETLTKLASGEITADHLEVLNADPQAVLERAWNTKLVSLIPQDITYIGPFLMLESGESAYVGRDTRNDLFSIVQGRHELHRNCQTVRHFAASGPNSIGVIASWSTSQTEEHVIGERTLFARPINAIKQLVWVNPTTPVWLEHDKEQNCDTLCTYIKDEIHTIISCDEIVALALNPEKTVVTILARDYDGEWRLERYGVPEGQWLEQTVPGGSMVAYTHLNGFWAIVRNEGLPQTNLYLCGPNMREKVIARDIGNATTIKRLQIVRSGDETGVVVFRDLDYNVERYEIYGIGSTSTHANTAINAKIKSFDLDHGRVILVVRQLIHEGYTTEQLVTSQFSCKHNFLTQAPRIDFPIIVSPDDPKINVYAAMRADNVWEIVWRGRPNLKCNEVISLKVVENNLIAIIRRNRRVLRVTRRIKT